MNRLLGEERVIASEEPGTTRDSILIPFERDGVRYTLIDTAGVRRRARVDEGVERFSVIKTLQAIASAHVVIAILDAQETVAEQDASLLGLAVDRGRALVIGVNKWDALPAEQRELIRSQLAVRLPFVDFAPLHFISARHGSGVGELMRSVHEAYRASMREMATPDLTRTLEGAIQAHQPPLVRGRRIKLRYAHQGARSPGDRHPRQPDGARSGGIPALPRKRVSQDLRAAGYAGAHRIPLGGEPVCGAAQRAHATATAQTAANREKVAT